MVASPRHTLSQLVVWDKYASYLPEVQRRENYDEIVMRLEEMYISQFPNERRNIIETMDAIRRKEILPSMRSLQFGGEPILTAPTRGYNCSFSHLASPEAFAEIMYNLLCGSGAGYSVQKHHVAKLPIVKGADTTKTRRYRIHDQIEGWADAILYELRSHFEGTRLIRFDGSDIRGPEKLISSSGRKAPGPDKLLFILGKIREIMVGAKGRQLRPIEAHDIACWIGWCVVAGGVRRSALISLFSLDDDEMMSAKAGEWWIENPQRGRANNSAVLLRGHVDETQFRKLMYMIEVNRTGEPGIYWTNCLEIGTNPCTLASAPMLKRVNGAAKLVTMGDIAVGDSIWSSEGWTQVVDKWSNGVKKTYRFNTTRSVFYGTANHPVVSEGEVIPIEEAGRIQTVVGPIEAFNDPHDPDWVMVGLMLGDGTYDKGIPKLCIGKDDHCYFESEVAHLLNGEERDNVEYIKYNVKLPDFFVREDIEKRTFDRDLSSYKNSATTDQLRALLRGLYSANGSVVGAWNRITLKASSFQMIEDVQMILNSLGINSYYTTNKPNEIEWRNGKYTSKQSYDLNISTDRYRFMEIIGFIHPHKTKKIIPALYTYNRNSASSVVSQEDCGWQEVFDITVDNESHTFWCGGMSVHNCGEISLRDMQFCNLTSINFATVRDEKDFLNRVRLATYLGTLQATFTDFLYLRDQWVDNCDEEALLGVSITGICENLDLFYGMDFEKAALMSRATNAEAAHRLGINPAARLLTIKPEGSGTLAVEAVAAGVHYGAAPFWIKHFTLDKNTDLYKFLMNQMPDYVVDSPYVEHEAYFAIPLRMPEGQTQTEQNTTAKDTLDRIRFIYENWVVPGHRTGENTHNVSCTVRVRDEEWPSVTDWMWENRERYAAISFLHLSDTSAWTLLPQQPITEAQYGAMVNGGTYNGKSYPGWKDLDFDQLIELENNVDLANELACAGGACLI